MLWCPLFIALTCHSIQTVQLIAPYTETVVSHLEHLNLTPSQSSCYVERLTKTVKGYQGVCILLESCSELRVITCRVGSHYVTCQSMLLTEVNTAHFNRIQESQ